MTTEPLTSQQRLEAEKAAIDAMTDTTEQALASAAFRLKIAAMKGEKGASTELGRANKALADYREQQSADGDRFKNMAEVSRWIVQQGFLVSDRSIHNHSRYPGFPHKQKDGSFIKKQIEDYAHKTWENPSIDKPVTKEQSEDYKTGIQRETERKLKLKNDEEEGRLIDAAEEEARDAKLWAAVKSDIENNGTAIVHELINRILPIIEDDDLRQRILAINHDLRMIYEDGIAEIFNRHAQNGGVEA